MVLAWVAVAAAIPGSPAAAQERLPGDLVPPPDVSDPPVEMAPGTRYAAGPGWRWFFGARHRDVWTTPVEVPVLDPDSVGGGLRPVRRGGGLQTLTLHFRDAEGRYYLFRSVDKRISPALPEDLRNTPVGEVLQDQTSAMHPGGAWVVDRLARAIGVPRTPPRLYVMPDHAVLGREHRDFAGRLGMLVESPDHGPDGTLRFQGSDRVLSSEDLLPLLRSSPANRVDAVAVLEARLLDLLVGDPDRGLRQWRWLRYGAPGAWTWKGFPMDRDLAFIMGDGLVGQVGRRVEPKFVRFTTRIDDEALTEAEPELDRLLLAGLDRATWDSAVARVQAALPDSVIDAAVASMPPGWREADSGFLTRRLRRRRDALGEAADRFYRRLAREVDVQATEAPDTARIEIEPGGDVLVTLTGARKDAAEYFRRRFQPFQTREVRVFLRGGQDLAVVSGGDSPILVRVVGGSGDDVLVDATSASGGVAFYTHGGNDRVIRGADTRVDPRRWEPRAVTAYRHEEDEAFRDFGPPEWSGDVLLDYRDGAGVVLGAGFQRTSWGFRRDPWSRRSGIGLAVGTRNGGIELTVEDAFRPEGSRTFVETVAVVSRDLSGERFYGFGNDSERVDSDRALVLGDDVRLRVDLRRPLPGGFLAVGPRVQYRKPEGEPGGPLAVEDPLGAAGFGQIGAGLRTVLGAGGAGGPAVDLSLSTEAYPALWDAADAFGTAEVAGRGTLPLGTSVLRLRSGGRAALGSFPFHEAAFLGGRETLRGFPHRRFAGDRAAWGGAEWRVGLGRLTLLTRGDVGVLGLLDAGRVWLDGDSPEGWHTGYGGGVWFRSLGFTGSVVRARGEEGRWYLELTSSF